MDAFEWKDLVTSQRQSGRVYYEFLTGSALSAGVYSLPAGGQDPQQPHTEDEVYYVVQGLGQIVVAGEDRPVGPGSIVFVAAGVEHRFHSITEDLEVLVFFAPPEGSVRASPATPHQ
jgi:mannose-6-phosphate isomerase-like protein (cupin superfamily)